MPNPTINLRMHHIIFKPLKKRAHKLGVLLEADTSRLSRRSHCSLANRLIVSLAVDHREYFCCHKTSQTDLTEKKQANTFSQNVKNLFHANLFARQEPMSVRLRVSLTENIAVGSGQPAVDHYYYTPRAHVLLSRGSIELFF